MVVKPKKSEAVDYKANLWQKNLKGKRKRVEEIYYKAIDPVEQLIGEVLLDKKGNPVNFVLDDFNFLKKWERGEITSFEVLDRLSKIKIKQASKGKLVSKLKKFRDKLYKMQSKLDKAIAEAVNVLENEGAIAYKDYFEKIELFFDYLVKIDESQVKVVHGFVDHENKKDLVTREITLNQAIKYIKFNGIDYWDEKGVVNKCLVMFEIKKPNSNQRAQVHWFLGPEQYSKVFKEVFKIKDFPEVMGNNVEWLNKTVGMKKNA